MSSKRTSPRPVNSVRRAVLGFTAASLVVLAVVGIAGVIVLQRVGTEEAMTQAEDLTAVAGRGIVQPALQNGIVSGDAASLGAVDKVVHDSVLREPIVRVKIWDPEGKIVYSDAPQLIGSTFPLGEEESAALRNHEVLSAVSDLSKPENRYERQFGRLLEVYLPVHTPDGHELLFETYSRFESVAASGQKLWRTFLPVLAVTIAALALLEIPLAYRLAVRVRESQRDRERLLQKAIDASDTERRRIAGDLHDGPVQQLAGLSMSLSAEADGLSGTDPGATAVLRDAASRVRQGMRSLRSAVMGIYPPTLRRAGLAAGLADLVSALDADGVHPSIDVPADDRLSPETEALFFRASQEAIRNVATHAEAAHVDVRVRVAGARAILEIQDDGRGFSPAELAAARSDSHLGLQLLEDLARQAGGSLAIDSAPGEGTTLRVEVPAR